MNGIGLIQLSFLVSAKQELRFSFLDDLGWIKGPLLMATWSPRIYRGCAGGDGSSLHRGVSDGAQDSTHLYLSLLCQMNALSWIRCCEGSVLRSHLQEGAVCAERIWKFRETCHSEITREQAGIKHTHVLIGSGYAPGV